MAAAHRAGRRTDDWIVATGSSHLTPNRLERIASLTRLVASSIAACRGGTWCAFDAFKTAGPHATLSTTSAAF